MEQRIVKLSKRKAGGTAGGNSVKYSVNLPNSWIKQMCGSEDRLELSFDGQQIVLKNCPLTESVAFLKKARDAGHVVKIYDYMNGDVLCSKLYLNCTVQQLCVENAEVPLIDTAFGVNDTPTWEDLTEFFASRCIPKTREGLEHYLKALGLETYDPFALIDKTQGKMAEDTKWLKKVYA